MPWREMSQEDQRLEFVLEAQRDEVSFAELCRRYGVSRKTGYEVMARFKHEGVAGLVRRRSTPHSNPRRVSDEMRELLVSERKARPTWGPRKLVASLQARFPELLLPAASTVGELLNRHHLVTPHRRRHRQAVANASPLSSATAPNDVWTADYKGDFPVGTGERCHPLTIVDSASRYLLACRTLPGQLLEPTWAGFAHAFHEYGLPSTIRTDNGTIFVARSATGLTRMTVRFLRLGIRVERTRRGKPQDNGRHERLHRTLKHETLRPPRSTMAAQQHAFDRFRRSYNDQRPHEALGQRPPSSVYQPSPRQMPAELPEFQYPTGCVRRRVQRNGDVSWQASRLFVS